ncbi:MAG: hypothetical protein ACLFPD_04480 [Desulfosudaceae bacterium]
MTQAFYFPFTSIDAEQLQALLACFRPLTICLPSAAAVEMLPPGAASVEGLVLQSPPEEAGRRVEQLYRACVQWREATAGASASFFKSNRPPFFDENTVSYVRQEILRGAMPEDSGRPDPLLQARVFLRLAADHDSRQAAVDQSLTRLKDRERALFASLQGAEDDSAAGQLSLDSGGRIPDAGAEMTASRLSAWAALVLAAEEVPDLLVTTSPAVRDHLRETLPGGQLLLERAAWAARAGDAWRQELARSLAACLRPEEEAVFVPPALPESSAASLRLEMDLLIWPEIALADFLIFLSGRNDIRPEDVPAITAPRAMVACLVPA